MSKEFKSLNIKFIDLEELIKQYCIENYGDEYEIGELEQNKKNTIQYSIKVTVDSKIATLNFYKNGDGTVSIVYKVGKNQDISNEIAKYIKTNGVKDDRKSIQLSLDNINEESFNLLLEYIEGLNVNKIEDLEIPYGHKYKFKSVECNDELTLTYYKSKEKLLLQGKPIYIYSEVIAFLSAFMGFEDVIKNHSKVYNIDINPKEVRDDMRENLEESYSFIGETLSKVLSPVFVFRKLEIQLDDYSSFVFPALKTLEGYLKKILFNNGINIETKFNIFKKDEITGKFVIDEIKCNNYHRCTINCDRTVSAVEEVYNFLFSNRHPMFHANFIVDSTMIVEDRSEAEKIITDSLELIRRTYHSISQVEVNRA